ncbi:MAG TPA: hypothetical protein VJT31_00560 [Rugosimonospora sp.]|nr:hypothetical protein [Rugosimonospora sp.]
MRGSRCLLTAVLLAGLALLTGCGTSAAGAESRTRPAPSPTRWPASLAGGACQLLDFDEVAAAVGTSFDVAAASQSGLTFTCVLEQTGANLPDLALSLTSTQANPGIFTSTVTPKGSAPVADLGKAAYAASVPAGAGAGPGVEVGWLSGHQRIITLRLRTRAGTAQAEADALRPKLIDLARQIDMTTV